VDDLEHCERVAGNVIRLHAIEAHESIWEYEGLGSRAETRVKAINAAKIYLERMLGFKMSQKSKYETNHHTFQNRMGQKYGPACKDLAPAVNRDLQRVVPLNPFQHCDPMVSNQGY